VSGPFTIDAGAVYTPAKAGSRIVVDEGRVLAIGSPEAVEARGTHIDAGEAVVAPGFVDTHVHGADGADVMEATGEALDRIGRRLAVHGTTRFLPTTISAPPDVLDDVIARLGDLVSRPRAGARPAGIHMEGPFIAAGRRGTHPEAFVYRPDPAMFRRWSSASGGAVRILTMAPELDGVGELLAAVAAEGVTAAMGHSDATAEEAIRGVDRGVRYAVHTFNAMRGIHHREPGIAGAILSDDRVWAEIIADGIHVAPALVRIFARAKGPDRVLLATDGTSATGMPDGVYPLGGMEVVVKEGISRDRDGHLAGSTLTQDRALRNLIEWTGWTIEKALPGLTVNPARAAGIPGAGELVVGGAADLVLLDPELRVVRTYIGGDLVHDAPAH
jgi:N-acetylglucosamine-6-phosphate deacetylase